METKTLNGFAEELEKFIQNSAVVKAWVVEVPAGTKYTDNGWLLKNVEPVNIVYKTKAIETMFDIVSKKGQALLTVSWPHEKWITGLKKASVEETIQKAIIMVEFLYKNCIFVQEGEYASATLTIESNG
jgi:hypothetical protein